MLVQDSAPLPPRFLSGLLPWQSYFLAFVLGIFAFKFRVPALTALVVLAAVDTMIRGLPHRLPLLVFAACAAFGFGYASQRAPEPVTTPAWMEARQPVAVHAVVDRVEPRRGGRMRLVLRDVEYVLDGESAVLPGKVAWNWWHPDRTPEPGQTVTLEMRVVPLHTFGNPGGWDYEWYWRRQGVNWRAWPAHRKSVPEWGVPPGGLFWRLKVGLRKAVASAVPRDQGGAVVLALTTGDKSRLSQATVKGTRSAGLAHTLALSGLHVGFVAAIGAGMAWLAGFLWPPLLLRVPRPRLAVWLAAPLVLGYAWLGQPSPSLIRASVMFAFWGFLLLQGRGRVLLDGLFFALAVIVFLSPFSVFDLSLQMSAAAVAGIGLMSPWLKRLFRFGQAWWQRLAGWAAGCLGVSVCANIALLPLVSWSFGTFAPNILLNLAWLPVIGLLVMPLGLAGMVISAFHWTASLGTPLLTAASFVMDGLLSLLNSAGGVTPVFSVLRPLWPEILGVAVLLVATLLAVANRRILPGLAGLGLVLMVWPHAGVMLTDSQDTVRLSLLDVGQGQAALISTPGGHRWLIDGGGGSSSFDMGEAVVAPYLTYGRPPRLDGVFMSHPDTDHSHGLPFILSRFDIGVFYTSGLWPRGRIGKLMRSALARKNLTPTVLKAGQTLMLARDVRAEILHPASGFRSRYANETSLVLRLVRGDTSLALIPGDVEQGGIGAMLRRDASLRAEVLVLPHHGSRSSLVPAWYSAISPDVALCSSGYINRYGFPHAEVLNSVGVPVYTTAEHGMVSALWPRGLELSVKAFRP